MNGHLNDERLIEQLYGVSSDPHVENCQECSLRLNQMRERRAELAAVPPVSNSFFAAQRREIYARLGRPVPSRVRWAPAMVAAACLLVAGLFVYRPATTPVTHTDVADAQLFSEVYSMEDSTEPIAAAPIHALFEDNQ
jgi:hypothetical protein